MADTQAIKKTPVDEIFDIAKTHVDEANATQIVNDFESFTATMNEWRETAFGLVITSEDQVTEMAQARAARLALVSVRTSADKRRKELKENSMNYANAVQNVYNKIRDDIKEIEDHLMKQEKYVERLREERIKKTRIDRTNKLHKYIEFVPTTIDLGVIPDDEFNKVFNGAKLQYEHKIAEEKRIENERLELEKIQKLHNERKNELIPFWNFTSTDIRRRNLGEMDSDHFEKELEIARKNKERHDAVQEEIRIENERLKKEAEEKAKKEREKNRRLREKQRRERELHEQKLKKEREERERIERELNEKKERERQQKIAAEKEEEARLKMGDQAKFDEMINDLKLIKNRYTFKSRENIKKYNDVKSLIDKIINHVS